MTPDPERAKFLFLAAADLPSRDQRAAYLYRECGTDTQLRARVEALLAADEGAASLGQNHGAAETIDPSQTMASVDRNQTIVSVASSAVSSSIALPPQNYVVGREIAHGGMGSVLHAQDCKLGRDVAMKVMRLSAAASEEARSRFIREATVLARLEHPNIVPIHELGWDAENRLYYTMKLVQGRTLQAVLNGLRNRDADFIGHYTLDRLLTIFRKVCDAMSLAHAKGVIHRDLKPDNIMVGEFGEVLVMDWGLAKIQADAKQAAEEAALKADVGSSERFRELADSELSRSAGLTLDGAVMGTPLYMSPEQAGGRLAEIDQQSDIFSLGGILYALLTLHPPVDGKTADEIMSRIKGGQILPPTVFNVSTKSGSKRKPADGGAADPKKFQPLPHCPNGRVPSALSAVTMRALSVDKSKRYKTVAELAADIEAYQGGFATSAEHAGLFTQLRLLIQRHKREFGVAFAAWVIITGLAVWFVVNLRAKELETRRQAEIARQNEMKAVAEATRAAIAEKAAKEEAVRATAAEQSAKVSEQNAKTSEAVAVQERESARQSLAKSALSLAEAARREGDGPQVQTALMDVPEDLRDSTWNYLLEQSDTSIARIHAGGKNVAIDSIAANPRRPGVFAVFENNDMVAMIDARTGARLSQFKASVVRTSNGSQPRLAIAFSPDGQRIAVGRSIVKENHIAIHNASDGQKLLEWDAHGSDRLEFSPDGTLLLQEEWGLKHVNIWNATDGKLAWDYTPTKDSGWARGAFSSNGSQVVTYGYNDGFRIVNASDGKLVRGFRTGRGYSLGLATGSTGLIASFGHAGFVTVYDPNGGLVSEFRAYARGVRCIGFAPGGEQLVTALTLPDGRQVLTVWQARTGERVRSLLGGLGAIGAMSIHPLTGELLVCGPNCRSWSLAGKPATWEFKVGGHGSAPVFWGSDDILFASGNGTNCGLQQLESGNCKLIWNGASFGPDQVGVSANGKVAALANHPPSGNCSMMCLRNPGPSPEEIFKLNLNFRTDSSQTVQIHPSPGGDRIAFLDHDWKIDVFDGTSGKESVKLARIDLDRAEIKQFLDLGWLADGQRLVALCTAVEHRGNPGADERIVLWDAATGKILQSARNRTTLGVLAVSPNGTRFAEAGADMKVRIRDGVTLAVLREFRANDGVITAMAWHPTKPILATASDDLTVKLWNLETGRRLEEFRVPTYPVIGLAFSPTGRRLASFVRDENNRIWEPQSLNDRPATSQPADAWDDLLTTLTPETVEQTGNGWRMEDGALFSPNKNANLPLPGNFAASNYNVRVKLRQLVAKDAFYVHLPVGNRMVRFEMEGFAQQEYRTGLASVGGKSVKDSPGAVHGKVVKDAEQHDLEASVGLFGTNAIISVTLDGQPLYEWSGPIASLSDPGHRAPGSVSIGAWNGGWVVYEVRAKRQ